MEHGDIKTSYIKPSRLRRLIADPPQWTPIQGREAPQKVEQPVNHDAFDDVIKITPEIVKKASEKLKARKSTHAFLSQVIVSKMET